MKIVLAAALLLSGGGALAQSATLAVPGTAPGAPTPIGTFGGQNDPSFNPAVPSSGDMTPTMYRERLERAQMVDAMFPELGPELAKKKVAGFDRLRQNQAYRQAERKARWARINASEGSGK
ncbi:hypothetical protein [Sphingomonas sp.]|jgi:ABC-type transport system substrate-binding protein|uniref:hypothetical protein n=1 Tax=Sphingomonas sp. TaxID=28214 RepID=UPI00261B61A4|nr:hypothetical protein [Sphingomonas sp.]MDF2495660.1 hypothetical protein [Sphingomonas sp.]